MMPTWYANWKVFTSIQVFCTWFTSRLDIDGFVIQSEEELLELSVLVCGVVIHFGALIPILCTPDCCDAIAHSHESCWPDAAARTHALNMEWNAQYDADYMMSNIAWGCGVLLLLRLLQTGNITVSNFPSDSASHIRNIRHTDATKTERMHRFYTRRCFNNNAVMVYWLGRAHREETLI